MSGAVSAKSSAAFAEINRTASALAGQPAPEEMLVDVSPYLGASVK
jgi:hypothetical protein